MNNLKKGFTLVEIMIVVAIIAILAAVAIPNFIKYRKNSQANACIANLKEIQGAKEQLLMNSKTLDDTNLFGAEGVIKVKPKCPADKSEYNIGDAETDPTCTSGVAGDTDYPHKLPTEESNNNG